MYKKNTPFNYNARTCYELKRSQPLQLHKYEKTDLQLKLSG